MLITSFFYLMAFLFVRHYYSIGLPYYDSVGSYVNMFSIANETRQYGFFAGIKSASGYSLSYLQSTFAVFASYLFPNAPQFMIILNFLTLFVAQCAIFLCVKRVGFGNKKAYLVTLLPVVPGIASGWAGGYIDMRRDISMLYLLTAGFFTLLDYMWEPTLRKGILVGIILGLTQWSRGNALPYILAVSVPLVLIKARYSLREKKIFKFVMNMFIPLLIMVLISLPFYLSSGQAIYEKYVFGSWGLGAERLSAVADFFRFLIAMILGPERNVVGINSVFLFMIFCVVLFLLKRKVIFIDKHWYERSMAKDFLLSGLLIVLSVFILNPIILGVGLKGGIFPNFPSLIGVFGIVIYLVGSLQIKNKTKFSRVLLYWGLPVWVMIIFLLNTVRIYISMPPKQEELLWFTQKAAADLSPILAGKAVSYMWLDHIHVHDLNFYITQKGGIPISAGSKLSWQADTEMPPNIEKSINQQQREYAQAMRTREYIVVSQDFKAYEDPKGFFFILMYGRPIIEDLLKDPKWENIYTFTDGVRTYKVLKSL